MKTRAAVFAAGLLAGLLTAAPAFAWGPLTHGLVADRAFTVLAPQAPWLTPQRDAFLWGAVCADLQEAPGAAGMGRERTHGSYTVKALWLEATRSREREAQAFALGWASHVAADGVFDEYADNVGEAWGKEVTGTGPQAPKALLPWAVDAALVPKADNGQWAIAVAIRRHLGTPAGAPIQALLARVLDVEPDTYENWSGILGVMCSGDTDRYLALRARWLRLGRWADAAREPGPRQALGELTPWITRSVRASVARVRELAGLEPAAPEKDTL